MWHCHSELCRVVLPLLLVEIFRHLSKWSLNKIVPARLNKSALTYYLSWTCVCFCFIPLSDIWFLKTSVSCMHASSRACAVSCHYLKKYAIVATKFNWRELGCNNSIVLQLCGMLWCNKSLTLSKIEKRHHTFFPLNFLHPIKKNSIGWILKQAT